MCLLTTLYSAILDLSRATSSYRLLSTDRKYKATFSPPPLPPASASGRCALAALAALPARSGGRPQRLAARHSAVWTCRLGWGRLKSHRFLGAKGGDDFKRDFTGAKGRKTRPRRTRRLWATLGWASSNAKSSWRRRAGAIGGGTEAILRWRRMRVITDFWVMAAMMRREPRWQNGRSQGSLRPPSGGRQVAISRSNTRPSSLAQFQYGVPPMVK